MHDDQEDGEDAADHDQTPRHLMRPLIFFAYGSDLGLRKHAQRYEAGGETEADNPVEQERSLSVWRGLCGVFAQKKGSFASSQIARSAARKCNGQ